jgi:xanthine/CO dehydrogenase XdhC/CoxF family maturation factor
LKDIYDILDEVKQRRGAKFALATLVRAQGSSYRRAGARMLVRADGEPVGSLSAGCVEREVASRAFEVLKTGHPALMSFDTRKRFGCAGKIDIFIEPAPENFLLSLAKNLDARFTCVVITRFSGDGLGTRIGEFHHEQKHEQEFVQEIHPPIRLFIFGSGPDNLSLHLLARSLGWQTCEVADSSELSLEPDAWTAAIVKTHNYGRDFAALQQLLPLNLRYVGLIGPRKRRNELLGDLLDLSVTINAGFSGPAGLDLGAETPEEIALAVIAEIQRVFANSSGLSLRDKKMPIHARQLQSFRAKSRLQRSGRSPRGQAFNPVEQPHSNTMGSLDSASLRSG